MDVSFRIYGINQPLWDYGSGTEVSWTQDLGSRQRLRTSDTVYVSYVSEGESILWGDTLFTLVLLGSLGTVTLTIVVFDGDGDGI